MDPSPLESVMIGAIFCLLGAVTVYGGIKMGSGAGLAVVGLGTVLGGLTFAMTGLVRWVVALLRR